MLHSHPVPTGKDVLKQPSTALADDAPPGFSFSSKWAQISAFATVEIRQFSPNWKVHQNHLFFYSRWFLAKKKKKWSRHHPVVQGYPRQFQKKGRGLLMRGNCRFRWGGRRDLWSVWFRGRSLAVGQASPPSFTGPIFCDLEEEEDSEQRPLRCTCVWKDLCTSLTEYLCVLSINCGNSNCLLCSCSFLWNTATDGPGLSLQLWIMLPVWCCTTITLCLSVSESGSYFHSPYNLSQCFNWVIARSLAAAGSTLMEKGMTWLFPLRFLDMSSLMVWSQLSEDLLISLQQRRYRFICICSNTQIFCVQYLHKHTNGLVELKAPAVETHLFINCISERVLSNLGCFVLFGGNHMPFIAECLIK